MPAPKTANKEALEHIAEAYVNYRRYERFLNNSEDVSWAIVALFYSAVHLMQAYAHAKTPANMPTTHIERGTYVWNQMKPIAAHYERLKTASEWARYDMGKFNTGQTRRIHDEAFKLILNYMSQQGFWWETAPVPSADEEKQNS